MEDFTDHVTHLNTVDFAPQVWDQKDIKVWIPFSCVLTLTRYGKTGQKKKNVQLVLQNFLQNGVEKLASMPLTRGRIRLKDTSLKCIDREGLEKAEHGPGKWKATLRVLPPTFKPVLQQIKLCCKLWNTDFWLVKITWESRHTRDLRYLL